MNKLTHKPIYRAMIDKDKVIEWIQSQEGRLSWHKEVNRTTWDVGLPKIYMDEEGYIIKHYKCGLKIRISEKKEDLESDI